MNHVGYPWRLRQVLRVRDCPRGQVHLRHRNQLGAGEPVPCTTIYAQHQGEVILDGGLTPGEAYSVVVNGKLTNCFTAGDPRGRKMAVAESPVEIVEG